MYNPLKWSAELISSFFTQGVEYAVISPGSRSTPLTLAAAFHPHLKTTVVLDERSAAYLALGIGKATGKPALLICTSGTAVANYYPAVIEAGNSGVPMIILSADRPPNFRGIGSSQTIDQLKIFGNHTVFFHDAGEPKPDNRDYKRLIYAAKQAVDRSISHGGASHINLPFRKPLEPNPHQVKEIKKLYEDAGLPISGVPAFNIVHAEKETYGQFNAASRPLIIAGPANTHHQLQSHIHHLSALLNAPIIAEPGSGLESSEFIIHRYEQFLRNENALDELTPDMIIRFGDQPFTKSILSAMDRWADAPVIHVASRPGTQDEALSVRQKLFVRKNDSFDLTAVPQKANPNWLQKWQVYDKQADDLLEESLGQFNELSDGHIFHHLSGELANHWNVMLSNSFPVRDMALFGKPGTRQFVNRGAAGIDGITSTALGIHLATGMPTCCITGDLAFLHDSNALLSIHPSGHRFLVVVINNGGGTIFRMLPINQAETKVLPDELFAQYFETPQQTDIGHLATAAGLHFQRITSIDELKSFRPDKIQGSAIVECITNPDQSMKQRQKLWNF